MPSGERAHYSRMGASFTPSSTCRVAIGSRRSARADARPAWEVGEADGAAGGLTTAVLTVAPASSEAAEFAAPCGVLEAFSRASGALEGSGGGLAASRPGEV